MSFKEPTHDINHQIWKSLHDAPRDRPICLFLPGVNNKIKGYHAGRPDIESIGHGECIAVWDKTHGWIEEKTGRQVSPSWWRETDAR